MTRTDPIGLDEMAATLESFQAQVADLASGLASLQSQIDGLVRRITAEQMREQAEGAAAERPGAGARIDEAGQARAAVTEKTHSVSTSRAELKVARRDNLCLIKGIDPETATTLEILGLCTFAELARLYPEDVAEIGEAIGDRRRISRENWIEQAAILARGDTTAYLRRPVEPETAATPTTVATVRDGATVPSMTVPTEPQLQSATEAKANRWMPEFVPAGDEVGGLFPAIDPDDADAGSAGRTGRQAALFRPVRGPATGNAGRQPRQADLRTRLIAAAASLAVIVSATTVFTQVQHDQIAKRIVQLSTCNADSARTNRDCAMLTWLSL